MKSALSKVSLKFSNAQSIASKTIEKVTKETGTILDDDIKKQLKQQTLDVVKVALSVAKNLADLNSDGKVDKDDLKYALNKVGLVWDKIDSDLKEALLLGGVASFGVSAVPFFGKFLAIPTFAGATAIFFVRAKVAAISVKKIIKKNQK